jgi:hypothetical protein
MNARACALCFQRSAGIFREFQSRSASFSILNALSKKPWNTEKRRKRRTLNGLPELPIVSNIAEIGKSCREFRE